MSATTKPTGGAKVSSGTKRRPSRRAIRSKTGELKPPWSGYREQQELIARTMSAAEIAEARRMAQLLTTTGLPANWLAGPLKSDLGPLFDVHDTEMKLLEPVKGLFFHEGAHRYRDELGWFPYSVTGVISDLNPEAKKRINETKPIWEPRGLKVHSCLEHHLLGEAELDPGEYRDLVDPLLACWLFQDCEVLAVEFRLSDPVRRIAGCFDFLIRTAKGTVVLGDLKTVGSAPAAHSRKAAAAQLGGYTSMLKIHHPQVKVDRCATVVAGPGVTVVKPSGVDECVAAWEKALERHEREQEALGF